MCNEALDTLAGRVADRAQAGDVFDQAHVMRGATGFLLDLLEYHDDNHYHFSALKSGSLRIWHLLQPATVR